MVACSHGTSDPAGRQAVDQLRTTVAAARPGLRVVEAYLDVQQPVLPDALVDLGPAIVVPLLLASGYHVNVDITDAVEAAGPQVRMAAALGPDAVLVEVLAERLEVAGLSEDHGIVLAAAGSSDRRAVIDVERTASGLSERLDRPVLPAYASAAEPRIHQVVARLRSEGRPVAVSSYLLAPGFFYGVLRGAQAEVLAAPLLPHPAIADLVLRHYDELLTGA